MCPYRSYEYVQEVVADKLQVDIVSSDNFRKFAMYIAFINKW